MSPRDTTKTDIKRRYRVWTSIVLLGFFALEIFALVRFWGSQKIEVFSLAVAFFLVIDAYFILVTIRHYRRIDTLSVDQILGKTPLN